MERRIGETSLLVTLTVYCETQRSIIDDEFVEEVALLAVRDEKTGQTGHVYYTVTRSGREVDEEHFYTDNRALFADNHPEPYNISELAGNGGYNILRKPESDVNEIISDCRDNELEYRAGNPDGATYDEQRWGLYTEAKE